MFSKCGTASNNKDPQNNATENYVVATLQMGLCCCGTAVFERCEADVKGPEVSERERQDVNGRPYLLLSDSSAQDVRALKPGVFSLKHICLCCIVYLCL